jgi:two-component system cell cycle response regulator
MRILISDDDFTSRSILAAVLRKSGHEVTETTNGREAWEALCRPDAPRLVVLDWVMPEMDGLEVIQRVRGMESPLPPYIIMVTAKNETADLVAGLDAGADDYVSKPFNLAELRARIKVAERVVRLQARLSAEASVDALTELPNRAAILRALGLELSRAEREGGAVAVGILDIDHFKRVNDTLGHAAGDAVLSAFGNRCRTAMREYDTLGRYGGEEFLLVVPMAELSDEPWERVREAIASAPFQSDAAPISITASLGVSFGRADPARLIEEADEALYRAKHNGRNRVEYAQAPSIRLRQSRSAA